VLLISCKKTELHLIKLRQAEKHETKIKIYKPIILPMVLYGCETWSLTLREEHRLRVFENRVLRGIFGPKREKLARGLKKTT
jgi:hypothetical protein